MAAEAKHGDVRDLDNLTIRFGKKTSVDMSQRLVFHVPCECRRNVPKPDCSRERTDEKWALNEHHEPISSVNTVDVE
jgi:hypothetical protein